MVIVVTVGPIKNPLHPITATAIIVPATRRANRDVAVPVALPLLLNLILNTVRIDC